MANCMSEYVNVQSMSILVTIIVIISIELGLLSLPYFPVNCTTNLNS